MANEFGGEVSKYWIARADKLEGFQNAILNDVGVPRERLSGLESFEGLDPAEWCARGYAICNVDARGSYESEGDIYVHGAQVPVPALHLMLKYILSIRTFRRVEMAMIQSSGSQNSLGQMVLWD